MPENYEMKVEPASFTVTGNDAVLTHTIIVETVAQNWWWFVVYIIATIGDIVVTSFFVSGWTSFGISTAVAVGSSFIGYWMLTKVVTITRESR